MPVTPKRCVLKGLTIQSVDQFYSELVRQLKLPPHFGRNLDALWDVLSNDLEGPIEIHWEQPHLSRLALGQDFERIVRLFKELAQERSDVTLHIG